MSLRIESWAYLGVIPSTSTWPNHADLWSRKCLISSGSDHQRPSQISQFPATLEDHRARPVEFVLTLHKLSSWFVPTMHQQKAFSPASWDFMTFSNCLTFVFWVLLIMWCSLALWNCIRKWAKLLNIVGCRCGTSNQTIKPAILSHLRHLDS